MASLVDSSDPNYLQIAQPLRNQKRLFDVAYRRKGEKPKDLPHRSQCVDSFTMASLGNKMQSMQQANILRITVIGNPYPPSVASFKDLKKITIRDMTLETNHRGSYLLLRLVYEAMRMTAVMNVVEDEAGTVSALAVYMQEPECVRRAVDILPQNRVLIVKEPYFKLGTNGQYSVRVDHPTDIIWLSEDDSRIPQKWRSSNPRISDTSDFWKKRGNALVGQGKPVDAIEMYSRALRSGPISEEEEILHNNLAFANLQLEAYEAALRHASFISNANDRSEKGIYRSAQALYGLGRYQEALDVFEIMLKNFPLNQVVKQEITRDRLRINEKNSGAYNFQAMYKASTLRPPRMDNATYKGPVEVRKSEGRGRGLFTTKAVKLETYFSKKASKSLAESTYLIDVPGGRMTVGTQTDLIRDIANKLALNPSLHSSFDDLYHGDYAGIMGVSGVDAPVVDTFQIAKTVHLNCFGSPLTSRDMLTDPELNKITKYTPTRTYGGSLFGTSGLWLLASYMNHSCVSTCQRSFIGDLLIVRAIQDLPANTEMTISYIGRENEASINKTLSSGWGFKCKCALCIDDRQTTIAIRTERAKLMKTFKLPNTTMKRRSEIVKQLAKTYQKSPSEVPRHDLWDMHYSLFRSLAQRRDPEELIQHIFSAFEALGFVIEGGRALGNFLPITVKQWGSFIRSRFPPG